MDRTHHTPGAQARFDRLMCNLTRGKSVSAVVEKTPHNVARIGFLEALTDQARYIHIVRNGVDVVRSIDHIATTNAYRIAGKTNYNQWWGSNDCKWEALAEEGKAKGYFSEEVDVLKSHVQRGAYEWLVSLGESDRWRDNLGSRLCEVTYEDLTSQPDIVLRRLTAFLGIACPDDWLDQSCDQIRTGYKNRQSPLELPPLMCRCFNRYQQRYGFSGRATPADLPQGHSHG